MLKILHYIPGFLYGGIETMFLAWHRCVENKNVQFELLIRTQDDDATALKEYRDQNGEYYRLPTFSAKRVFEFKKQVDQFFETHNDYDILHAHEVDPFILSSAKKHGIKKIIVHSHTTSYGNGVKSKIRFWNEQIDIKRYADFAFACSKKAALWKFGSMTFKNNPVSIIHNAISTEKYDYNEQKRNSKRNEMNFKNKFVIGNIGRLTDAKNQFFLLDIFSEYLKLNKNTELLFIGDGPDEKELKEKAKNKGILEKIRFLGARNDVNELLQAMDCFVLPSKWEGLPVTLMEAQASGVACVISDIVTEEADITNNVTRISLNQSVDFWAKKLENIRRNFVRESTRIQIIDNGFDVSKEVLYLITKYKKIVGVD